jgi:hypothetical protein
VPPRCDRCHYSALVLLAGLGAMVDALDDGFDIPMRADTPAAGVLVVMLT